MRNVVVRYIRRVGNMVIAEGFVRSEIDPARWYSVYIAIDVNTMNIQSYRCTCDDYYFRKRICKHIYAMYKEVTKHVRQ